MIKLRPMKSERERGEIMLESMIIITVTMFILFWLIGLSFLYYERYIVTIITNDAAKKVAETYNYPTSDIIMGYVTPSTVIRKDTYRHAGMFELVNSLGLWYINDNKVEAYVKYLLDITNFPGSADNIEVNLIPITDTSLRKHIKVTTTCKFNTPMGGVFGFFGMDRVQEFEASAFAEVIDIQDYMATISYAKNLGSIFDDAGDFLSSLMKMLNSFVKVFNQFTK